MRCLLQEWCYQNSAKSANVKCNISGNYMPAAGRIAPAIDLSSGNFVKMLQTCLGQLSLQGAPVKKPGSFEPGFFCTA